MKKVAIIAPTVLAAVGATVAWNIWTRSESNVLALRDAELQYVQSLADMSNSPANPLTKARASVFLSARSVNSILEGLNGVEFGVPNAPDTTLRLEQVQTEFKDGFPGVRVAVSIHHAGQTFSGALHAVLLPKLAEKSNTVINLTLFPLELEARVGDSPNGPRVPSFATTALRNLWTANDSALPHVALPLTQDLSVSYPANNIPVVIPTQSGRLHGEVKVPGMATQRTIRVSGVIFLSDGLHILLSTDTGSTVFMPYAVARPNAFHSASAVEAAIRERTDRTETLRRQLAPKLNRLKVNDADVQIWVSRDLAVETLDLVNALGADQRRLAYHTLSEEGQTYSQNGGGVGCGGYVNVAGGNSADATLSLSQLATSWSSEGIKLAGDLSFEMNVQLEAHMNGPAGPRFYMQPNCISILGQRMCTDLPSVTVSCDTPVGGGVGLGSYGIHAERSQRVGIAVHVHADDKSWLIYDLSVESPDDIPITAEVGLGQLGTAGIPFTFPIPHNVLISGRAPDLFEQTGEISIPGARNSAKHYDAVLRPTGSTIDASGYSAKGSLSVRFTPAHSLVAGNRTQP